METGQEVRRKGGETRAWKFFSIWLPLPSDVPHSLPASSHLLSLPCWAHCPPILSLRSLFCPPGTSSLPSPPSTLALFSQAQVDRCLLHEASSDNLSHLKPSCMPCLCPLGPFFGHVLSFQLETTAPGDRGPCLMSIPFFAGLRNRLLKVQTDAPGRRRQRETLSPGPACAPCSQPSGSPP